MVKPLPEPHEGICSEVRRLISERLHLCFLFRGVNNASKSAIFLPLRNLRILLARPGGRRLSARAVRDTPGLSGRGAGHVDVEYWIRKA